MSRLVVVSNRVRQIQEGKTATGGLAVAVLAALREDGGIWFGWSGEVVGAVPPKPDLTQVDRLTYATIGMTRRDYNEYYNGFANATLWPLFHYRLDLAKFSRRNFTGYLRVNANFAKALYPPAQDRRCDLGARLSPDPDGPGACAVWDAASRSAFSCIRPCRRWRSFWRCRSTNRSSVRFVPTTWSAFRR